MLPSPRRTGSGAASTPVWGGGLSAGSERNCWRAGSLAQGDFYTPDAVTVAFLLVLLSVRYFVEFLC